MREKRVLHIIETLDRGGAELLFVNYINSLPHDFKNVIVFLRLPDTIKSNLSNYESIYCLNYNKKVDGFAAISKLSGIIRKYKIDLVHSHLYWPTILARLCFRNKVPLVFSVHNLITKDAFEPNILSKYLEKTTYSGKQHTVFVSEAVANDYRQHIKIKGPETILYNFIRDAFYTPAARKESFSVEGLKLVTVGNLKAQKNFIFLLDCLKQLEHQPITLDIYGEGPDRKVLESYLVENKITNVRLMGAHVSPECILKAYDVFVSSSKFEGFYIAMVEAMAVGLPCIVPDLEVLKEISEGTQLYYKSNSKADFIEQVAQLNTERELLKIYAGKAVVAGSKYKMENHIKQLTQVYTKALQHGR